MSVLKRAENESEADLEGFKLFEGSTYNFDQAKKAFGVLQYADLPFELVEFKRNFLETESMKLPNGYFLKKSHRYVIMLQ